MSKYIKTKKVFMKDLKFTPEQLKEIEEIVSKYTFKEVAKYLNFGEDRFSNLRIKNQSIKIAVEKGLDRRGNKKTKNKDCSSEISMAQSSINMQQKDALKKFKTEYEKRKLETLKKQVKNIDLI